MRLRSMPGVGLGIGGFGLGLVAYGVDALGIDLPAEVLIGVIVLGGLMVLGGIALEIRAHRPRESDDGPRRTGIYTGTSGVTDVEDSDFGDALDRGMDTEGYASVRGSRFGVDFETEQKRERFWLARLWRRLRGRSDG